MPVNSVFPDDPNVDHDNARKNTLWGGSMAGAWGLEWSFGYKNPESDLTCQDWRSRDNFWNQCRSVLERLLGDMVCVTTC